MQAEPARVDCRCRLDDRLRAQCGRLYCGWRAQRGLDPPCSAALRGPDGSCAPRRDDDPESAGGTWVRVDLRPANVFLHSTPTFTRTQEYFLTLLVFLVTLLCVLVLPMSFMLQ
jgi:hypothetical protein